MKLGFFINPLAGYGIISNLKGSDGLVLKSHEDSKSVSRALKFLDGVKSEEIEFYVPSGIMGSEALDKAGITSYRVIYAPSEPTTSEDTAAFVRELNGTDADILAFVGGDGTARDILAAVREDLAVVGIPAGMKMYSSVFSISVRSAVSLIKQLSSSGTWETTKSEVVDIDEDKFRKGELDISLFGEMTVPVTPLVVSESKAEYSHVDFTGISEYIGERMRGGICYVIGPGSTCKSVLPENIGATNILGFDILIDGKIAVSDADESEIYRYVSEYPPVLVISPIGGQNFLLGRGNKQISSRIVEKIGWNNICVISSQEKLSSMANLFVDIDNSRDIKIPAFIKVLYGYGRYRMIPVKR